MLGKVGMYVMIIWGCEWMMGIDVVCIVHMVIDISWY